MKLAIVSNHNGIHGAIINLLDLQEFLTELGFDVVFYHPDKKELNRVILLSRRPYKLHFKQLTDINEEIVITDFKSLITGPQIKCDKLIVFDTVELSFHLFNLDNDLYFKNDNLSLYNLNQAIHQAIFIMPKVDIEPFQKKYSDLKIFEFYKPVNVKLLKQIKLEDKSGYIVRWDISNKPEQIVKESKEKTVFFNQSNKLFEYNNFFYEGMIYYKRKFNSYFEQFGRLVFELLLLNKKIIWYDNPYEYNDGLKNYLEHYGTENLEDKMSTQNYYNLFHSLGIHS